MSDARPRQYVAFHLDAEVLAAALKLPLDHRVVRVQVAELQPGLPPSMADRVSVLVIVEGPSGFYVPTNCPVTIVPYPEWLDELTARTARARTARATDLYGP